MWPVCTNPIFSWNDPAGQEVLSWCCMTFSPLLWQNHLLSVNKGVHKWECGIHLTTINHWKKEPLIPWVPYKLSPPTLSLEKWHHTGLCPQRSSRAHKNWILRLTFYWFLGITTDSFTSSEELFPGSFIFAAPSVCELQFSSFTL